MLGKNVCRVLRITSQVERRYASSSSGGFRVGKFIFYSLSAATLGAGGTYAYAFYDPSFRKSIEEKIPQIKPLFTATEKKSVLSKASQSFPLPLFESPNANNKKDSSKNANGQNSELVKIVEEILDKKLSNLTWAQKGEITDKIKQTKSGYEKELQEEISRLNASHARHEEEMLRSQRESLNVDHKRDIHEALLKERKAYTDKLAESIAQLTALETFLNGRDEFDGLNRRAKKLWISCQSLKSLLTTKSPVTAKGKISSKPFAHIIADIKTAGESDEFVQSLISSIPEKTVKVGLYSDEDLVDRYEKVKKLCRRLARIGDNGASLFQYVLSYLQSLFIFDSENRTFSQTEIDPDNIATYEVLSRTSYCLKKKDFESAIKLMSLLRGEPAKIASDWLRDLRIHVEINQLADLLTAHASAQSIRSLY